VQLRGGECISCTHIYWILCPLQQLHSSVRTGNLETCLRLLSLGAQANFFPPEKGTTPLHVAAKAGQTLQAELLVVYGADPGSPDVNGRTPIDYAR
jgi:G protein-coupled receptor kinase interactor 1